MNKYVQQQSSANPNTDTTDLQNRVIHLYNNLSENHNLLRSIGNIACDYALPSHYDADSQILLHGFRLDSGDHLLNMAFCNERRLFRYTPRMLSGGLNTYADHPDYRVIRFETSGDNPSLRSTAINIFVEVIVREDQSRVYEIRAIALDNGDGVKINFKDDHFINNYKRRDNDDNGAGSAGRGEEEGRIVATGGRVRTTGTTENTNREPSCSSSNNGTSHSVKNQHKLTGEYLVMAQSTPIKSLFSIILVPFASLHSTFKK